MTEALDGVNHNKEGAMEVYVLVTLPDVTEHPDLDIVEFTDFRPDAGEPDIVPWLGAVEVKVGVDTDDPAEALVAALGEVKPIGGRVERATVDRGELYRIVDGEEREIPYDSVGVSEIARIRGVSRQYASQQSIKQGFPAIRADLSSGPVWRFGDVTRYLRDYGAGKKRTRRTRR